MSMDELYGEYSMPLKIAVVDTTFSHPENFVNRSARKGEITKIDDPEGSWMNAGAGGESNTVDLALELQDATGKKVSKCDIIPIKIRLWCCENGYLVNNHLDEIKQDNKQDKSGHRRSEFFMVSGKASSALHILHNGSGLLSVRITTTSQLNERRRFSVEVIPDLSPNQPNSAKLSILFHNQNNCKAGDTVLHNANLSTPIEVMSKINKLAKRRDQNNNINQANVHLEKALSLLQNDKTSGKKKSEGVQQLLAMCAHIQSVLVKGSHTKIEQQDEIPRDVVEDLYSHLDKPSSDVGILDLGHTQDQEFNEMYNNYLEDSSVVDCLYTHKDLYVTLDHHGHGKFSRGKSPHELLHSYSSTSLSVPVPTSPSAPPPAEPLTQHPGPSQAASGGDQEHHYQILKIPFTSHAAQDIVHASEHVTSPNGHHHNFDPRTFMNSLHMCEDKLRELFNAIDTDRNGYICYPELLAARDNELLKGSDEDIEALHRWMDNTKNDLVDFEEFKLAMTLLPSSTTLENLVKNFRVHEENEKIQLSWESSTKRLKSELHTQQVIKKQKVA